MFFHTSGSKPNYDKPQKMGRRFFRTHESGSLAGATHYYFEITLGSTLGSLWDDVWFTFG